MVSEPCGKKWKNKHFAAGANREEMERGATNPDSKIRQLLDAAILDTGADVVATGNPGCMMQYSKMSIMTVISILYQKYGRVTQMIFIMRISGETI